MANRIRKKGISALVASKNSEKTIELCIRSFLDFGDEIIVVDNGSTDNTVAILERLAKDIDKLKFYNCPDLPDLYHNRQFALEHSNYNWIFRLDSDFIAYTDGEHDIKKLRKMILENLKPNFILPGFMVINRIINYFSSRLLNRTVVPFRPLSYGFLGVHVVYDYLTTGIPKESRADGGGTHVWPPVTIADTRGYQYYPGMKFIRLGRCEGVSYQGYLRHIVINKLYWMHCEIKTSDMDHFYRSELTNWRELGNFTRYPTLHSYICGTISEKYGTSDIGRACELYMKRHFSPYLMKYDTDRYYPYPKLIEEDMKRLTC